MIVPQRLEPTGTDRGSAQECGRQRRQSEVDSNVRRRTAGARDIEKSGHGTERAPHHHGGSTDQIGPQADQLGGLTVGPHRVHAPPEGRVCQHEVDESRDHDERDEDERDTGQQSRAE